MKTMKTLPPPTPGRMSLALLLSAGLPPCAPPSSPGTTVRTLRPSRPSPSRPTPEADAMGFFGSRAGTGSS
jgi:hypothetical protein